MHDHDMTTPEQAVPSAPRNAPERKISAETISNLGDLKPVRLAASRDDAQIAEGPRQRASALPEAVPPQTPSVVPAEPQPGGPAESESQVPSGSGGRKKTLPILVLVAAALVLVLGLTALQHFNRYGDAQALADGGMYAKARDTLFLPSLTKLHDPDFLPYLDGGELLTEGVYREAREILEPLAAADYRDAASLLLSLDYHEATDALYSGDLSEALRRLEPLASIHYLDSQALYRQAKLSCAWENIYDTGNFSTVETGLRYMSELVQDGYEPARADLESARELVYQYAVGLYENTAVYDAREYFQLVAEYSQAEDYLTLCDAQDHQASLGALWELRGFADADTLLLTDYYLTAFLEGSWYTGDRSYYLIMGSDSYLSYNLPWFEYGEYYRIEEGIVKLYSESDYYNTRDLYRISIDSWDQIIVYCYKNSNSYTLYRE